MITRSYALKNQKRAKNASKMIKFPCDISPRNIPSISHAIWVAVILRYTISRCISVWVPIVFMCCIAKRYFFAISHIACCVDVRSLLRVIYDEKQNTRYRFLYFIWICCFVNATKKWVKTQKVWAKTPHTNGILL